jgi:hypothetical protein
MVSLCGLSRRGGREPCDQPVLAGQLLNLDGL